MKNILFKIKWYHGWTLSIVFFIVIFKYHQMLPFYFFPIVILSLLLLMGRGLTWAIYGVSLRDVFSDEGKMNYVFSINGDRKTVKAKSIDDAVAKAVNENFPSLVFGKISYLSSDDPDAPNEQMKVGRDGGLGTNYLEYLESH